MEGKIFKDSSNIYQDQAKVLFKYYKSAAEKIIAQEVVLEGNIKHLETQVSNTVDEISALKTKRTIALVLFFTCIGLIYYFIFNSKIKKMEEYLDAKNKEIEENKKKHSQIFRNYKVEKLGVAYVPVASRVAFDDKSFLIDHTGIAKQEKFTLQILRQNKLIDESINELRELTKEAPIIESSESIENVETSNYSRSIQSVNFHDYFGKLDRTLRTISYGLGDIDETNVELPVIYPNSDYGVFLTEHATNNCNNSTVFNIFKTNRFDNQISEFKELNEMRKSLSGDSQEVDKSLRHLMVDMAASVQTTSTMKISAIGSLIDYSNRIMYNILKAPYNFYSPILEAEEIERIKNEEFNYRESGSDYKPFDLRESSRMKFDLTSMCWVDENGGRTITPFGVNQIQSEIMAPIVTNLLKETYKERLSIYNHINDQKIDYLNQWHRDTEDFYGRNRAEAADLISMMRSNLSDYTAAYNTLAAFQKTEENMRKNSSLESAITESQDNSEEVLLAYQQQSEQFKATQNEFADYMERLHDDIDVKAAKFGHVEHYDASLRDRQSKDLAVAVDNVSSLDERRKPLAEVNPLMAQTSELPPVPSVEDMTYEHIGLNLITLAKEAIEDLDTLEAKPDVNTTKDEVDFNEENDSIEDQIEEDLDVDTIIDEEDINEENDSIEDQIEEDQDVDTTIDEEDINEENDLTENQPDTESNDDYNVGMEFFYFDDEGNKLYYDDGEYDDEANNRIIVVQGGKIVEIRNKN